MEFSDNKFCFLWTVGSLRAKEAEVLMSKRVIKVEVVSAIYWRNIVIIISNTFTVFTTS